MKRIAIALFTVALLTIIGCGTSHFPYMMSLDRHNFISTPALPLTFILRDTIENKDLIHIDIPVNKMLVVDLDHDTNYVPTQGNAMPANKIYWEIVNPDTKIVGPLENEKDLSGNNVMMKLEVRPKESVTSANTPTYQPTTTTPAPGSVPEGAAAAESGVAAGSGTGSNPAAKTPTYQPVQPQPAPAGTAPESGTASGAAKPGQSGPSTSGTEKAGGAGGAATKTNDNKINLPVPQGPAVRDTPKYQPRKPAPNGEDLQKALD